MKKKLIGFCLMGLALVTDVMAQDPRPDVNYDESKILPYTLPALLKTEN